MTLLRNRALLMLIVGQTVYQTVPYTVDERTTPSVAITQAQ